MLRYKIIKQRNALNENKAEMYYPRLTGRIKYDINAVAEKISDRSSLSKGDIIATLISLEDIIPELLKSGNTVELGALGSFSLQASASTTSDESQVSWRSFRKLTARFRAGKALKIRLSEVHFSRSSK